MTYTWKVNSMRTADVNGVQDAVIQTYWTKTGTSEDGSTGSFMGATPFSKDSIDPEKFVPFAELTEEIVLGWIQATITGEYEAHINERIARQIAEKAAKEVQLPWESSNQ